MKNKDVLMVLPKKTILVPSALKSMWDVDKDPQGVTIFNASRPLSHANWENSDDFGNLRPCIVLELPEEADMDLFDAMVSRLAVAYESLPERYPLYIRIDSSNLELIAHASRIGFVPYFGNWKEKNADESAADWETITQALRVQSGMQESV